MQAGRSGRILATVMRQLQQSSSDFLGSRGLGFLQIFSGWLELLMQQKALQKDTAAAGTAGYSRDNPGSDFVGSKGLGFLQE